MPFHDGIFIDVRRMQGRLSRQTQNAILLGLYDSYSRSKKLLNKKPQKIYVLVSRRYTRSGQGVSTYSVPSGKIAIVIESKRPRMPPYRLSSMVASDCTHELHHFARLRIIGSEKFYRGVLAEDVLAEGLALAFQREVGQPRRFFIGREKIAIMASNFLADHDVKGKYDEWFGDSRGPGYAFSDAFVQKYLTDTGQKASQAVGVDAMGVAKLWISEGCKALQPQPRYAPRAKKRLFRPTWRIPQYRHLNNLRQSRRASFG